MRVEYLFGIFFPLMCWTTLFVSEIYLFFNRSAVVMIEKVVYLFLFSHSVFCRKSWNCLLFLFSLSFSPPTPFFLLLKPVRTDPDEALEVVSGVLTTDHVTGRKKRKWCPSADEKKNHTPTIVKIKEGKPLIWPVSYPSHENECRDSNAARKPSLSLLMNSAPSMHCAQRMRKDDRRQEKRMMTRALEQITLPRACAGLSLALVFVVFI